MSIHTSTLPGCEWMDVVSAPMKLLLQLEGQHRYAHESSDADKHKSIKPNPMAKMTVKV